MLSAADMSTLPPLTQLAGNHGTLFEGYFQQLDVTRNGRIDASSAAAFLKKSQLGDPVLHKIWDLSDPNGKGYLDSQGFYVALRLVAACQLGKEPSLSVITLSDPPPRLMGVDSTTIAGFAQKKWTIEPEDKLRFDKMFQGMGPVGGKLSGEKARPIMLASKLPVDALGKIWNLSDIDRDGQLDAEEFAVAMRLIQLCQAGELLPPSLPASIIPLSKRPGVGLGAGVTGVGSGVTGVGGMKPLGTGIRPSPSSPSPSPVPPTSSSSSPTLTRKQEWVVSQETKAKYDKYFEGIDKDKDGLVSGDEARGLFMASNLSSNILAHVWNLCDSQKRGKLNAEQFALAMFLIAEKVRGKELPTELAPNMIPPSLRGKSPPSGAASSNQVLPPSFSSSSLSSVSGTSSAASLLPSSSSPSSVPPLLPTMTSNAPPLSLSSAFGPTVAPIPVPAGSMESGPDSEGSATGFSSDFTAIKELDTLTNEITGVKSEKVRLQEDIRLKQELIKTRKGEIGSLQDESNTFMRQREELEREKGEYLAKLEQLDTQKAQTVSQIAEAKQKCQDEQEEIERLKAQLSQQEGSKRAQGEELERLKVQLENLKKEEREYKQRVETGKAELEKLQKANQNRQSEIKEVRHKIDRLKEEHLHLNQNMSMYSAAGSTPGSTPSSSVININDVGQLPMELHVPHISEPDAVSARATAGSSSPVSSLSGFSTNSHLEEGGEEGGVTGGGGGGKEDRTPRNDPFAGSSGGSSTTSQANDPFAAFAVPGNDHFSLAGDGGGFKPTSLSSFDPFGMADAFKSVGGGGGGGEGGGGMTRGEDIFKSDPFSSNSASAAGDTNTATDPFSGQDPFSSDPFASTTSSSTGTAANTRSGGGTASAAKSTNTSSLWGSGGAGANLFGSDPFSSGGGSGGASGGVGGGPTATTPTDPFSSDPFMEDPFGTKGSGGGGGEDMNPFASDSTDVFGSKGWANSTKTS